MDARRGRWAFAIGVMVGACLVVPAQAPAAWTPAEAMIAALLPELCATGEVPNVGKPTSAMEFFGYCWKRAPLARSDDLGFVVYAWPKDGGSRTFALSQHGVVVCGESRSGYGPNLPAWDAALAGGGDASSAQFLVTPGKGRDGQFWQPVALQKLQGSRIVVVDRDRKPVAGVGVAVGSKSWLGEVDNVAIKGEVAVGLATTSERGEAVLRSVPVSGARVALCIGRHFLDLPLRCAPIDGGFEVVLDAPPKQIRASIGAIVANNEVAAMATCRAVVSAQAQLQACGAQDADGDGTGEYGFFAELTGFGALRRGADPRAAAPDGEVRLKRALMPQAYANVQDRCVVRWGYLFQLWLPTAAGWSPEANAGGAEGAAVDAQRAESHWRLYAWPLVAGRTGQRAYFVNESGEVLATANDDGGYSGRQGWPAVTAALLTTEQNALPAANGTGVDGRRWVVMN